jgi:propanol-preferring alcohol dehydrogenase
MQSTGKVSVNIIPIPKMSKPTEILVKIASASLCHSDIMLIERAFPGPGRPVTMGHEGVGQVEQVGDSVKGFKEGDRIGFLYITGCCCAF